MSTFEKLYNSRYFASQVEKFNNRKENHWAPRIEKTFSYLEELGICAPKDILDLGCSIGTYAYEFAERGYNSFGVDLSVEAINIAKEIAGRNGLDISYKVADITEREIYGEGSFDIIYAGDIIEHLEEGALNKCMGHCFYWLRPGGYFIFHTVPTKYDYIFHKSLLWLFLVPFSFLPDKFFKSVVEAEYAAFDKLLKMFTGKSRREREAETVHCNLQTLGGFKSVLERNGFVVEKAELEICEERFRNRLKLFLFGNKEYFQKDFFGVAVKREV